MNNNHESEPFTKTIYMNHEQELWIGTNKQKPLITFLAQNHEPSSWTRAMILNNELDQLTWIRTITTELLNQNRE